MKTVILDIFRTPDSVQLQNMYLLILFFFFPHEAETSHSKSLNI